MTSIRKSIALVALAAALVFPTGVFAVSATGSTPEDGITGPSVTISLTAPASYTYVLTSDVWKADYASPSQGITNVGTNNATGLTVTVKADAFTGDPTGSAPTTVRSVVIGAGTGAPFVRGADIAAGGFVDANTSKVVLSTPIAASGGALGFVFSVPASAFTSIGATYTSAIHFTATSN